MKKLMFIASAMLCGTLLATGMDSSSVALNSGVVGYSNVESDNHNAPLIGAMFKPVSGASTYDLRDLYIAGEDSSEYADPGTEFIRVLDPNSLANTARYTYISYEWMADNFDEDTPEYLAQFAWAIGWWQYVPGTLYQNIIEYDQDQDNPLRLTVDVPVAAGSGFIGNFSIGHSLLINFPGVIVD